MEPAQIPCAALCLSFLHEENVFHNIQFEPLCLHLTAVASCLPTMRHRAEPGSLLLVTWLLWTCRGHGMWRQLAGLTCRNNWSFKGIGQLRISGTQGIAQSWGNGDRQKNPFHYALYMCLVDFLFFSMKMRIWWENAGCCSQPPSCKLEKCYIWKFYCNAVTCEARKWHGSTKSWDSWAKYCQLGGGRTALGAEYRWINTWTCTLVVDAQDYIWSW